METCCGYGYGLARESHCLARIFKGRRECTGQRKSRAALRAQHPYLRANRFQGVRPLQRKENSSRDPRRRLRARLRCRTGLREALSVSRFGNINPFPFRHSAGCCFLLISSISTGASTTGHNLLRGLPDLLLLRPEHRRHCCTHNLALQQ